MVSHDQQQAGGDIICVVYYSTAHKNNQNRILISIFCNDVTVLGALVQFLMAVMSLVNY